MGAKLDLHCESLKIAAVFVCAEVLKLGFYFLECLELELIQVKLSG